MRLATPASILPTRRFAGWTRPSSTSAWITTSRPQTPYSRASATTRPALMSQAARLVLHHKMPLAPTRESSTTPATWPLDRRTSYGTGSCKSAQLGIPGANLGCPNGGTTCTPGAYSCGLVMTQLTGGYWAVGDRGYTPFQGGTNIFTVNDTLDMVRGKHDIRFGIGIRANQMNVGTEAFQDGFWIPGGATGGNFTGFASNNLTIPGNPQADFLLGITGLALHDQTYNGPVTGRRWKVYRPFIQDDWRVTKDLTLNLGLAWDVTNPISEAVGRM